MKIYIFLTLSLIAVLNVSCSSKKHSKSPDLRYNLEIETSLDSDILIIQLFDNDKNLLDELDTGASDVMKWSLNWYNDTTFVLHSHDIGTYVWNVDKESKFAEGALTDEINMSSINAFNEKYRLDIHSPRVCMVRIKSLDD